MRFGAEALSPGGVMHEEHVAFMSWAASYDDADLSSRSLALHETWLSGLPCPVLRLQGDMTVKARLRRVLHEVSVE